MNRPTLRLDVATLLAQIEHTPGIDRLLARGGVFAAVDSELIAAIVEQAADFCAGVIAPISAAADREGCRLVDGRVVVPAAYRAAWASYTALGWPSLDLAEDIGGQGLPLFLSATFQQLLDGSCPAFGMLPVLVRSAARLIAAHGSVPLQAEWLPRLVAGEWAATICISEAEAGSDAMRVRTAAEPRGDGTWAVTGEKMWISFGDHDLCPRIGHCVLARTERGLSLFLVPNVLSAGAANAVAVRRIERKLGLHGSPTCVLGFEGAQGWLIGEEGFGLAHLFVMIVNMRLCVGAQGLGIAAAAVQTARGYAAERRQGGSQKSLPVTIVQHADVQRQLLDMIARLETLRGLGLLIGVEADLASHDSDPLRRERAAFLVAFLLPIYKTMAGSLGFELASEAIQVLGGAGYTDQWPAEQALRDSRIATIFEGTTGMQARDLLHRRVWQDECAGLEVLLDMASADLAPRSDAHAAAALAGLVTLKRAADGLMTMRTETHAADAGSAAFLELAGTAALGWIAARLCTIPGSGLAENELRVAGEWFLRDVPARCDMLAQRIVANARCGGLFARLGEPAEQAPAALVGAVQ